MTEGEDETAQETGPFSHLGSMLPRISGRSQPQNIDAIGSVLNYGETHLAPWTRMKARHYEIARLLFLGKNHTDIAARMDMTPNNISLLANDPKIMAEVERMRDLAFSRTVAERLKDIGPESMDVIEEAVLGKLDMKVEKRVEIAQWVVEKLDGKATQKVDVASSTLDKFMSVLTEMREEGETLDVSPAAALSAPEGDELSSEAPSGAEQAPKDADWGAWLDEKVR